MMIERELGFRVTPRGVETLQFNEDTLATSCTAVSPIMSLERAQRLWFYAEGSEAMLAVAQEEARNYKSQIDALHIKVAKQQMDLNRLNAAVGVNAHEARDSFGTPKSVDGDH